jgi:hypothetical protein
MNYFQFRVDDSIMSTKQSMPMSTEPRHLVLGRKLDNRLFLQVDRI